jgi:NAD(P)H-hydrate epimerase
VVDADGLALLRERPLSRDGMLVLTPHPGEAARLLDSDSAAVQADRFAAVAALARTYRAVTVLKGNGTLVAAPGDGPTWLCPYGHAGMATAGTGDVLAGLVGTLLAAPGTLAAAERVALAVLAHALAGDHAARSHGRAGLVAGDLVDALPQVLR